MRAIYNDELYYAIVDAIHADLVEEFPQLDAWYRLGIAVLIAEEGVRVASLPRYNLAKLASVVSGWE